MTIDDGRTGGTPTSLLRARASELVPVLALGLVAAGCGSDAGSEIVGKWTGRCTQTVGSAASDPAFPFIVEFREDGTFSSSGQSDATGRYTVDDGRLRVDADGGTAQSGSFAVTEDTLTLVGLRGESVAQDVQLSCDLARADQ